MESAVDDAFKLYLETLCFRVEPSYQDKGLLTKKGQGLAVVESAVMVGLD